MNSQGLDGVAVLTGLIWSSFSWKFLCCSAANLITFECRKTPMVNYWSEDFNWQLPVGHFLTGVQTHHKNHDNG